MNFYIGTSGFSYPSWKNIFYPPEIPSAKWLEHYAKQFKSVELNNTFYKFPDIKNLSKFYARVPADFRFAVKAHKIITHNFRLKNVQDKIEEFTDIVHNGLLEKTGPILFQLPPTFRFSETNLEAVVRSIPGRKENVVEFRHASWWNAETIQVLRSHGLTFCNVSFPGLPETFLSTSTDSYIRMHGIPVLFVSPYSDDTLSEMLNMIPKNLKQVYIYFNNTDQGAALANAKTIQEMASQKSNLLSIDS